MRRSLLTCSGTVAAAGLLFTLLMPQLAMAQSASGPNVQRDCQTVRTCNFSRTGAVRGCLSSFSCRACKPVVVKCTLPGAGGKCQELRCDWGG